MIKTPYFIDCAPNNQLLPRLLRSIGAGTVGYVLAMITYFKSASILFSKLSAHRYGIGLSNELLCIILAQEAVKL